MSNLICLGPPFLTRNEEKEIYTYLSGMDDNNVNLENIEAFATQ